MSKYNHAKEQRKPEKELTALKLEKRQERIAIWKSRRNGTRSAMLRRNNRSRTIGEEAIEKTRITETVDQWQLPMTKNSRCWV